MARNFHENRQRLLKRERLSGGEETGAGKKKEGE